MARRSQMENLSQIENSDLWHYRFRLKDAMNFNSPQGDTAPIDLHMPETFHRLKRTVLLLCSALILLAFGTTPDQQTLTIPLFTIKLPATVVRSLLWGATLYYFLGFLMETRIVRLINSDVMIGAGMKTVDKAMEKLGITLSGTNDEIADATREAKEHCQRLSLLDAAFATPQEYAGAIYSRIDQPPGDQTPQAMTLAHRIERSIGMQDAAGQAARLSLVRIATGVETIATNHQKLIALLTDTSDSINKLSKRISGDRKFSFWIWEVGGVVGALLTAIVVNGTWLLQRLDWLTDTASRVWNSSV